MPDSPIFFHMQGGDGNGGVCLQVREKGSKSLKKSREFYVFFCFTERTFQKGTQKYSKHTSKPCLKADERKGAERLHFQATKIAPDSPLSSF
jgi:hypothetical protein